MLLELYSNVGMIGFWTQSPKRACRNISFTSKVRFWLASSISNPQRWMSWLGFKLPLPIVDLEHFNYRKVRSIDAHRCFRFALRESWRKFLWSNRAKVTIQSIGKVAPIGLSRYNAEWLPILSLYTILLSSSLISQWVYYYLDNVSHKRFLLKWRYNRSFNFCIFVWIN